MRSILIAFAAAPLLTGCLVAQSTFDAKQAELDAAKAEETQHDQSNADKIKTLQAQVDKLQKEIASAQLLNGDLSDQLKKLGQNVQNLAAEKGNLSESLAAAQKQMEALQQQEAQE